jgi:putative sterol carrier protein
MSFTTPDQIFRDADTRLRAGLPSLADIKAVFLFELTGQGGGSFRILIDEGRGSAARGAAADPDLTFSMSADDFVAVTQGDLDGALAFMTGRLQMRGDQALSLALAPLWLEGADWSSHVDDVPL